MTNDNDKHGATASDHADGAIRSRRDAVHRLGAGMAAAPLVIAAGSASGRPGQPVEIVPLYVLLATGEAGFTSGYVFASTGGKTAN